MDPEDFAQQVNYLAALGRIVVPRAFAFLGRRILFVGYEPFDAEELGNLLPDGVGWYEQQYAPEDYAADVVVLGRVFEKGLVKSVLGEIEGSPKVIPQEGFLDELLFGHDWWTTKRESLQEMVNTHRGLQAARSLGALGPTGVEKPQPKKSTEKAKVGRTTQVSKKRSAILSSNREVFSPFGTLPKRTRENKQESPTRFSWPSTEAEETRGGSDSEYDLRDRSKLKELGYDTTKPPSVRWRILTDKAVPELGLPKVAGLIAWFCRSRKQQRGGRQKFARAIGEWEHDLERLKREVYPMWRPHFNWPQSEP